MTTEEQTIYLGFDCSSKAIHCVALDNNFNIVTQKKWESKEKTVEKRFPVFAKSFWDTFSKIYIRNTEKVYVAIEQAIFISNPKTTIEIANVIGCVRTICNISGYDVEVVDNRSWKKEIIGNGNAKKTDIMAHAKEKWGDVFPEQDFADAACIAAWKVKKEILHEEKE